MGIPDIHEPSEMRPRRTSLAGFAGDDDMICGWWGRWIYSTNKIKEYRCYPISLRGQKRRKDPADRPSSSFTNQATINNQPQPTATKAKTGSSKNDKIVTHTLRNFQRRYPFFHLRFCIVWYCTGSDSRVHSGSLVISTRPQRAKHHKFDCELKFSWTYLDLDPYPVNSTILAEVQS